MTTEIFGIQTIETVHKLYKEGIRKLAVIMRHSARHYDLNNPESEPFMTLTEEGKIHSFKFGEHLPQGISVRVFSSFIGRCIETAYLIDKGYASKGGKTESNTIEVFISPFYAKNPAKILKTFVESGNSTFIRRWMDGDFSSELIEDPKNAAQMIADFARGKLDESLEDHIDISVTHDWNLYLLKEVFLGLRHEEAGTVEYLEGVIMYKQNGNVYITNHQTEPRKLEV